MTSKLVEKWERAGIMGDMTDEEKEVLASHLEESSHYLNNIENTGMFLAGEEVEIEKAQMMLIVLTSRVYREYKTPFNVKHLYDSMVKSFNNFSGSMLEMAVMGIDVEMEFISIFSEMYNPKHKEVIIEPKKFVDRFKLR
jgi:hypothetical protein